MPARKKPLTLQTSCLRCIGCLFRSTCHCVTQEILDHLAIHESHLSFSHLKSLKTTLLSEALTQIQQCFFMDTAHYFHKEILTECLVALSDLVKKSEENSNNNDEINAYITPVNLDGAAIRCTNMAYLKRKEIILEFLDVLCYPGAVIKHIDLSINSLGSRWKLHRSIVTGICNRLVHIPNIEELNLGHWSCRNFSLLADHNQIDGWPLEYLSQLTVLRLQDVSQRLFQSIGTFCPNLKKLHVFGSDITDTVTWWVSKCQRLETVELFEDRNVTPVGYAQLLRSNPKLKSLGRCDCFGQVLFLLYDNTSMYRRSYSTMPEHLSLEEVDTNGSLNHSEIKFLVQRCPNLKKIRFKYIRDATIVDEQDKSDHLAKLSALNYLTQVSITCANFYEHQVFQFLEVRGDQIINLELVDVDEVNLNAVLLIGGQCLNLQKFCLHGCHFQMQPEDASAVDALCREKLVCGREPGQQKRIRLTSTSSAQEEIKPFEKLKSLDVYLKSPTHLPIFQLLLGLSTKNLEVLIFDQFYCDYEESLINRSLFEWNPLQNLKSLTIGHGTNLSIVTVNIILANCHELKRLGRLDQWGHVDRHQIESIRNEIKARNLDLVIDTGEI